MNLFYVNKPQMTGLFKNALVWFATIAVLFAIGKGFVYLTKPAPGEDVLRFCVRDKKLSDLSGWPELRTVTGEYRVLLNKDVGGAVCSSYYPGFVPMFPGQLKSYIFDVGRYPAWWNIYVELGKVGNDGTVAGLAKYPLRRSNGRAVLIVENGRSDLSDSPITYVSVEKEKKEQ